MVGVVGGLVFIAVVALIIVIIVVVCCLLNSQQKGKVVANVNRAQSFGVSTNTAYIASNRDGPPNSTEEDRNRRSLTVSQHSSDLYYDYILTESTGNFRRLQLIEEEDNPTSLGSIIQDNVAYNSPQEVKEMQKILAESGYVHNLM